MSVKVVTHPRVRGPIVQGIAHSAASYNSWSNKRKNDVTGTWQVLGCIFIGVIWLIPGLIINSLIFGRYAVWTGWLGVPPLLLASGIWWTYRCGVAWDWIRAIDTPSHYGPSRDAYRQVDNLQQMQESLRQVIRSGGGGIWVEKAKQADEVIAWLAWHIGVVANLRRPPSGDHDAIFQTQVDQAGQLTDIILAHSVLRHNTEHANIVLREIEHLVEALGELEE